MSSYIGEKVEIEEKKKNSLTIFGRNYNCLRLVFAKISKVY